MADPLSITASIAGVVTLADIVYLRLVKYARSAKNAEKEIIALAKEVNLLGGALNSLSRTASGLEVEPGDEAFRMHHIEACSEILQEINKKLDRREKKGKGLGEKLTWPFTSIRVEEMLAELGRHKESINLALNASSMAALLRCLARQDDIRAATSDILTGVRKTNQIVHRIEEDSNRQKILNFFLKYNPQKNYETSLNLRHPRTGLWLTRLPAFRKWLSNSDTRIWLSGIPGAGKTILAGSIIEEALAKTTSECATAFFCDYKDAKTHDPVVMLSVIAYQLALQKEEAYNIIEEYFAELHPSNRLPKPTCTPDLQRILERMIGLFDRVFLVVDGLDECTNTVDHIIEVLVDISGVSDNSSVALLSRDEVNIREKLQASFDGISIAAHQEDITEYVTGQHEERIKSKRIRIDDMHLKEEILRALVDGAQGMFRWVACQLDHLGECFSDQECRDALEQLPPTLNETYSRILRRLPQKHKERVQMILNFIAYATPQLTIHQLKECISIPPPWKAIEARHIIGEVSISKLCSSLIRKSNDGLHFEFAHFSVTEFLRDLPNIDPSLTTFGISHSVCNRLLALCSLQFLQLPNFDRCPEATEQELGLIHERECLHPLYGYAAVNWPLYARREWADVDIQKHAESLFEPERSNFFISWAVQLRLKFYKCVNSKGQLISDPRVSGTPCSAGRAPNIDDRITAMAEVIDETFSPLHLSSLLSLDFVCTFLTRHGINVNQISPFGTPIQCAVGSVFYLVGDVFCPEFSEDWLPSDNWDYDPIHHTIATIECLWENGASLSGLCARPFHGYTIFTSAFLVYQSTGNLLVIEYLLTLGICPTEEDTLDLSVLLDRFESVEFNPQDDLLRMLQHRMHASVHQFRIFCQAWEYTAFCDALDSAILDQVIQNLECKSLAEITIRADDLVGYDDLAFSGLRPAHIAARYGFIYYLQSYLEHPDFGDIESRSGQNVTLLHMAALSFREDAAVFLLERGADIHAQTVHGDTALHLAVMGNGVNIVRVLLQHNAKLTTPNFKGKSPLVYAYESSNDELIDCIHQFQNADAGQRHAGGGNVELLRLESLNRAFSQAVISNDLELCRKLRDRGCDIDMDMDCNCCSPLIHAIGKSREKTNMVAWLISEGASTVKSSCRHPTAVYSALMNTDLVPVLPSILDKFRSDGGNIALLVPNPIPYAIKKNNIRGVEILLEHVKQHSAHYMPDNEALRSVVNNGRGCPSPLNCAVAMNNTRAARLLLRCGADINAYDSSGCTPLIEAVRSSKNDGSEMVQVLIRNGAYLDCRDDLMRTPMILAAARGLTKTAKLLLYAGADPRISDSYGMNCLHMALLNARNASMSLISPLLRYGLDHHEAGLLGVSAVHLAMHVIKLRACSFLLSNDVSVESSSPFPWSVLDPATSVWLGTYFRLYRRKIGDANMQRLMNLHPVNGQSPLSMAASKGSLLRMKNMVEIGAELDFVGGSTGSALMAACEADQLEAVQLLVRRGATISFQGPKSFLSAIHAARKFPRIVQWLLVTRFTDQRKIQGNDDSSQGGPTRLIRNWSGITKGELLVTGDLERWTSESSFAYLIRLSGIKKQWRGRVVPSHGPRRTWRSSRKIPMESVRIHPSGYNDPNKENAFVCKIDGPWPHTCQWHGLVNPRRTT